MNKPAVAEVKLSEVSSKNKKDDKTLVEQNKREIAQNKSSFRVLQLIKKYTSYVDNKGNYIVRSGVKSIMTFTFAGIKFFFDRLASIIGLILVSPVFFIIAVLIKLDDGGPIFFKQTRTGKGGKTFTLYKIRTMVVTNDVHDFSKGDKYTKIGKILRRTSLDELGQLVNIARGDMSFIGPRPWITDYYENMSEIQRHRCDVRPRINRPCTMQWT